MTFYLYTYLSLGGFNSRSAWSIVTPLKFNSSSGLPVPSQPGERRTGSVPTIKDLVSQYDLGNTYTYKFNDTAVRAIFRTLY